MPQACKNKGDGVVGTFGAVSLKLDHQRYESSSSAQTEQIAARFAAALRPGDVVVLAGEMGSGKTVFVRGAARELGFAGRVTSPTFAIGNVYNGSRIEIAHLDLFRVDALSSADEALVGDFLTPDRIAFVEWPHDDIEPTGQVRARVTITHEGGDRRSIEVDWKEGP